MGCGPGGRLLAMDIYSFDFKLGHIAKHVQLPPVPQLGDMSGLPREERLPPLLVVNIQLPDYPVSDLPTSRRVLYHLAPRHVPATTLTNVSGLHAGMLAHTRAFKQLSRSSMYQQDCS